MPQTLDKSVGGGRTSMEITCRPAVTLQTVPVTICAGEGEREALRNTKRAVLCLGLILYDVTLDDKKGRRRRADS